jgi:hypothetical protein
MITKTNSTKDKLSQENFKSWQNKRYSVNQFFINTGYPNNIKLFNISQKKLSRFPIYKLLKPQGADLQIRFPNNETKPIRNMLSTSDMARLLYEIETGQRPYHQDIKALLNRKQELNPQVWQNKPYDSIEGFFGQGIYQRNPEFYSKMGWTFNNRNDAAIIASPDGKTRYILVVFGDDKRFYEDQQFFPSAIRIGL